LIVGTDSTNDSILIPFAPSLSSRVNQENFLAWLSLIRISEFDDWNIYSLPAIRRMQHPFAHLRQQNMLVGKLHRSEVECDFVLRWQWVVVADQGPT